MSATTDPLLLAEAAVAAAQRLVDMAPTATARAFARVKLARAQVALEDTQYAADPAGYRLRHHGWADDCAGADYHA